MHFCTNKRINTKFCFTHMHAHTHITAAGIGKAIKIHKTLRARQLRILMDFQVSKKELNDLRQRCNQPSTTSAIGSSAEKIVSCEITQKHPREYRGQQKTFSSINCLQVLFICCVILQFKPKSIRPIAQTTATLTRFELICKERNSLFHYKIKLKYQHQSLFISISLDACETWHIAAELET